MKYLNEVVGNDLHISFLQDDDADGEEEGEEEVKRAHKTSIGEMFSVREDQVSSRKNPVCHFNIMVQSLL